MLRYYTTPDQSYLCLVMTYHECDLLSYLRCFNQDQIPWEHRRIIFHDLLEGLSFMHIHHYVHLDIKLENVLLCWESSPRGVIADLGFSRYSPSPEYMFSEMRGSQHYSCPQILSNTPYIGTKADSWAAGVCLYALLYLRLPWRQPEEAVEHMMRGEYTEYDDVYVPDHAKYLLRRLLDPNESTRATIKEALVNPWFWPLINK